MMTEEVFITKYALTSGIERRSVEINDNGCAYDAGRYRQQYVPHEWHWTRPEAVVAAEGMRLKKLASLRKQIDRLQGLSFTEIQP